MLQFTCAEIPGRIAKLQQEIAVLQELLDDPELTPQQKASVRRQINDKKEAIAALRDQLDECQAAELIIAGVEMTQGTQFFAINGQGSGFAPDNSVPLVAQRMLILRVYVDARRAGQGSPQLPIHVSGRVIVDRVRPDGSVQHVRDLNPINGPIFGRRGDMIDRGEADHSLNFRVAASDCQGQLRFTVKVFEQDPVVTPTADIARPAAAAGAELQLSARFQEVPTFRVHAVLVHYQGGGMDVPAPTGLEFADTLDYVLRTFPIGRLEFEDCLEIDFDKNLATPGGGCGPGWEGPGGLMEILRELDDTSERPAIRVALIPAGVITSVGGCGNRNIAAAKEGNGPTLAQEMGHALDRKHAPAGGAPGPDPDYPTYNGYPSGSIGEYGFDVVSSDVYNPQHTFDFMSYESARWVSPYTYMGLLDTIRERFGQPLDSRFARALAPAPKREMLFLSFRVSREGHVELGPSFHLPAVERPAVERRLSEISCELVDASGGVLVFHRCELGGSHDDPYGPHIDFHEVMPWAPTAAAIRFLRGTQPIHVHTIESEAPRLDMTDEGVRYSETGSTLRWKGRHTSAALTYMIRYSHDGGATWRAVAANLTRDSWTSRQLPGGQQCLFQVVATSGIRTTTMETAPFSAPQRPRTAAILAPKAGTAIPGGRSVLLRGGAFSPDFGLGAPEDVLWTSNIDGVLGTGLEVVADGMSEGVHQITVAVPDGLGGVTTASTVLRITPSTVVARAG